MCSLIFFYHSHTFSEGVHSSHPFFSKPAVQMAATSFDKLNDDNYSAWGEYVKADLVRKELWGVVSGDVPRPIGSAHHKVVAAWEKKHGITAAEIVIHVSPKYITHCDDSDVIGTWNKLRMLFCTEGHSSAAALRHQFNSMWYDLDMSMWDWITKVEELAHCLEDIKSPMIPIDIINTLTCDLPDSYTPSLVLINSLLDDLNYVADLATVQEVIKCLLNKEAWQAEANLIYFS